MFIRKIFLGFEIKTERALLNNQLYYIFLLTFYAQF